MYNNKYTIDPFRYALAIGTGWLKAGDWIDMITGDTIVGPYCVWPKTEPRYFVVTGGRTGGKSELCDNNSSKIY